MQSVGGGGGNGGMNITAALSLSKGPGGALGVGVGGFGGEGGDGGDVTGTVDGGVLHYRRPLDRRARAVAWAAAAATAA